MLRFLSYMMSSPGRLIYENMTLGASGNSCVPAPAGGQALLGGPRYSQGQEFQDKKLQVRTQQHFKKHQGIFFFFFFFYLSFSILLAFATILKHSSRFTQVCVSCVSQGNFH